jgi:integrase
MTATTDYQVKLRTNGTYFIEYPRPDGSRARISLKTSNERMANINARKHMADAKPHAPTGKKVRTMRELFARCQETIWAPGAVKSLATTKSNIKILNTYIGDEAITDMTFPRLERLVAQLKAGEGRSKSSTKGGYSNGTIHRKITTVGAALTRATKEVDADGRPWLVGKPAMPQIKLNNIRSRTLSVAEEDAVLTAIWAREAKETTRDWLRFLTLFNFLLNTGCRLGEALGIQLSDVEARQHGDRTLTIVSFARYQTKNDEPRQVLLTGDVAAGMAMLSVRARKGRYFPLKPSTAWWMWDNIRKDIKTAGTHNISDVTLHTLRHTVISRLSASGVPIEKISKYAGHSSVEVTRKRYEHVRVEDHQLPILDALTKMEKDRKAA